MPAVAEPPEQEAEPRRETETIGERVRRLRMERGISQRDLAEKGVSYAYLSRIEAGQRKPSLKALRVIARKLRVPAEYLETGDPVAGNVGRDLRLSDTELALRLGRKNGELIQRFRDLLAEAHEEADEAAALRARIGLGLALAREGEYREAIRHLENATASPAVTAEARPDVFATLGRCYASAGTPSDAVLLFERCLDELPDNDQALRVRFTAYLSCALADRGDFERARDVLTELADRVEQELDATGRVQLYWSLARIASMQGDTVTAMMHMRRAVGLLEASEDTLELARAHLHCAEILILEGQVTEASPHIDRAARLFELGADHRDLGALRTQEARRALADGDTEAGIRLAREALDYLAENVIDQGSAWHALGLAQAQAGDVDAACASFERAATQLEEGGEWREACPSTGRGRGCSALPVASRRRWTSPTAGRSSRSGRSRRGPRSPVRAGKSRDLA
jgi:transcriptional regulator with XRE-family HTH domain